MEHLLEIIAPFVFVYFFVSCFFLLVFFINLHSFSTKAEIKIELKKVWLWPLTIFRFIKKAYNDLPDR